VGQVVGSGGVEVGKTVEHLYLKHAMMMHRAGAAYPWLSIEAGLES